MSVPKSELGELFDVPQAAAYLGGMKVEELRRHIRARRIRVVRFGRKVQIYRVWADEFRARHTTEPTGATRGDVPPNEPSRRPLGLKGLPVEHVPVH